MNVKINGELFFRKTADYLEIDSVHTTPHHGIDLATYMGTPLPSPIDGVVKQIYHLGKVNLGTGLKIETSDGTDVIFGHMSKVDVHIGDKVHIGQIIGKTGNTGFSTGNHLHVGAKSPDGQFIDPSPFVDTLQHVAHDVLSAGWSTLQCIISFNHLFL